MSVKTFIQKIGEFFSHLFAGAARAWKRVSPEVRAAIQYGSGVVSFINDHYDESPQFVKDAIQKAFPDWDEAHMKAAILEATKGLDIAAHIADDDLLTMIEKLQAYLGGLEGTLWAKISKLIATGIAIFTAPAGVKFDIFDSLISWAYHKFIKKDI